MNSTFLLGKLTPFTNKSSLLVDNQNTTDIIKQIIETHNLYKKDYDKIAGYFWKGNTKETCKYLFNFLKDNVKYSIEPDSRQSVKSPSAILATGRFSNGYNDCKHYSLFQAGVFDALNRMGKKIDWCYRFANYKIFSTTPHHVFVVVKIKGIEYWCDPVLETWNNRKPYINKIDKKMSLYSISGIGCNCQDGSYGMSEIGRVPKAQRRSARRTGENCTGRKLAKYAPPLIAGRKAFLLIVRLNFRHTAVKLATAFLHPESKNKILQKWCSFGGNAALLKSTVAKAAATYKRKHPKGKYASSIGIAPAALPAAWATALPIIAAMAPLVAAAAKFLPPGQAREITENITDAATDITSQLQDQEQETPGSAAGVGAMNPYLIYGALGLGAIYLIMSKKRK